MVEFWHALTDHDPHGSISIPNSSITPSYRESTNEASASSPFDAAGQETIHRLDTLPPSGWTGTVLDPPNGAINGSGM